MIISASFSLFFLYPLFFFWGGKETLEGNFMFFLLQVAVWLNFELSFFYEKGGLHGKLSVISS